MQEFSLHFIYRKPDLLQMLVMSFLFLITFFLLKLLKFWLRIHYIQRFMQTFVESYESLEVLLHLLLDIVLEFKVGF